jgi:hypothetical protein
MSSVRARGKNFVGASDKISRKMINHEQLRFDVLQVFAAIYHCFCLSEKSTQKCQSNEETIFQ